MIRLKKTVKALFVFNSLIFCSYVQVVKGREKPGDLFGISNELRKCIIAESVVSNCDTMGLDKKYAIDIDLYKKGKRDLPFLRNLATTATQIGDTINAEKVGNDYIRRIKEPYTKDDLEFMESHTHRSTDPAFNLFYRHPEKVDAILGENAAINKVKYIIFNEEIAPYMKINPAWDKIGKTVISKYGVAGEEIFLRAKSIDYLNKNDFPKFMEAAIPSVEKYGQRIPFFEINNYAWAIFENVSDTTMLNVALGWSKRTLQEKETITFMDTYANLLYKLGRKDDAIAVEEKATGLASVKDRPEFQLNLEKMKKGEKTWK